IYIPNAFTPNGDGENDVLYVRGINIRKVQFHLYNNLGERVFYTNNLHAGWDGNYKGEKQTSQVYVYHCDATFWDGTSVQKEGNVTLVE
ncbi:MAG TPA: gliding motility-associated C-terminal domain-containing protein, partial [Cytophagales bacterium]|nr:gliding motility-associated C-terminal domain-containing protein [Cytophagales bacterium]